MFGPKTKEWHNPILEAIIRGYRALLVWFMSSLGWRLLIIGTAVGLLVAAVSLIVSGAIGSEFLPHLD